MIKEVTPQIAALYLGQRCDIEWLREDEFSGIKKGEAWTDLTIDSGRVQWVVSMEAKIIPHLRRLSSMTEAEAREAYFISEWEEWNTRAFLNEDDPDRSCIRYWWNMDDERYTAESFFCVGRPLVWLYLLSKGFDLFGLIDAGLAKEVQ